jgi:hypothetical protein
MLRSVNHLRGFRLSALDGEIGHIRDLFFDDHTWKARYVVVDVGHWLPRRKVLIPPHALGSIRGRDKLLQVELTMQQVEKSPPIESDAPLSRQLEEEYLRYFGWPFYWMDPIFWSVPIGGGAGILPAPTEEGAPRRKGDPHLRSAREVEGYHLHTTDGDFGRVADFLIDDEYWDIRDLVVNTRHWLPGKKVLISPQLIEKVSWEESRVWVMISRDAIRLSPRFYGEQFEDTLEESIQHLPPP